MDKMDKKTKEQIETEAYSEKAQKDALQQATEVVVLANRVAYKAQRIAGYLQGRGLREETEREQKDKKPSLTWLVVSIHKMHLEQAEENLDNLCSLYDKIWEQELSKYTSVRLETFKLKESEVKKAKK
jgi:hypothetical protein